jgi:plastocyanin
MPALSACLLASIAVACSIKAKAAEVTAHVEVKVAAASKGRTPHGNQDVVLWLTPVGATAAQMPATTQRRYQLAQKNKEFHPHLLVVPVGSVVDFPNQDPFFHNVFSWFNGRKFDLGLYESGTSRSVHFDRAGISFIFCNIHPEMSAVVVSLPTPYFATSTPEGILVIHDVKPGSYEMHLWAIGSSDKLSSALVHAATIEGDNVDLGTFTVETTPPGPHKNKFGEDYDTDQPQQY